MLWWRLNGGEDLQRQGSCRGVTEGVGGQLTITNILSRMLAVLVSITPMPRMNAVLGLALQIHHSGWDDDREHRYHNLVGKEVSKS